MSAPDQIGAFHRSAIPLTFCKEMKKIYCDTGGFRKELRSFEQAGLISLHGFPYENRNKKVRKLAEPSALTWGEYSNVTWNELHCTWGSMGESELYESILGLIGKANRIDAMHVDSAYKSGCDGLMTSDIDDIAGKRDSILELTGLRVFNTHSHWKEFLEFIGYTDSPTE